MVPLGSLMYIIIYTRLDIIHTIGVGSRFLANLDKKNKWH